MRLGHVAFSVGSIKRSVAFYGKHFGMRLAAVYRDKDAGMIIAILQNRTSSLELFEFKTHKRLPLYRRRLDSDLHTVGVKHVSFESGDIAGVYRKFRKARVAFATDLKAFADGRRYFFVKDPDGILVEVMER